MVDYALIESKVRYGYTKYGTVSGPPYAVYRGSNTTSPILPQNLITSLPASWATDPKFLYQKPAMFGEREPDWFGAFDISYVLPGDYFVGLQGTFFLNDIEPFQPYHATWCNTVLSIFRSEHSFTPGDNPGYLADTVTQDTQLLTGWPGWRDLTGRHENTSLNLPGDAKQGYYSMRLPVSLPVTIEQNDRIVDSEGATFLVVAAQKSPLGWRLMCNRAAK